MEKEEQREKKNEASSELDNEGAGLIMLVEDDKMIIDMYKMRFEEEKYKVVVTDRGSEALRVARESLPIAIILDVILPEVDGFGILQSLRNDPKTRDIPVLLLTNLGQESDREKGLKMGAKDYFIKAQHTPGEIIRKVKELIKNEQAV